MEHNHIINLETKSHILVTNEWCFTFPLSFSVLFCYLFIYFSLRSGVTVGLNLGLTMERIRHYH